MNVLALLGAEGLSKSMDSQEKIENDLNRAFHLSIRNFTKARIRRVLFVQAAKKVLQELGVRGKIEISLVIVGDKRMRDLNKKYRGEDRVTDVLSFRSQKSEGRGRKEVEFVEPPDNILRLGEVVICYPQAKRQAKQEGHSLEEELLHLFVHGIMHLWENDNSSK